MKTISDRHHMAGLRPASTLLAVAALAMLFLPGLHVANAQDAQDTGQPARAVRLSYVDGKVTLSQDNQVVTDQAVANTPLLQGMTLATADDGRAEIQFEDGSVARISPDSSLTLKVLSGQGTGAETEMDVNKGLAYFELQNTGQAGQMRVRFDDSVVTGSGFTILRVDNDTPPGAVAVMSGNAHLEGRSGLQLDINGGETVTLNSAEPNGYIMAESIEPNSWDAWNSDRDQALNAEASAQTSAPADLSGGQNNPAWSDLDANGTWYNVPDQGYVWSPYDAANASFDPYGYGSWVWTPGFGYTWASAYSWGYLPYQCGAWNFYTGFGWGWAPGFGGCTPWWNIGYYGGPMIGMAPGWYPRVHRPMRPHGFRPGRPVPVIPVHRTPPIFNSGLPPRDPSRPVNINGHTIMAVRTLPARTTFQHGVFGGRVTGGGNAAFGNNHPAGTGTMPSFVGRPPAPVVRPGYMPRPGYAPRPEGPSGFNGAQAAPGRQRIPTPQNNFPVTRPAEPPQRVYTQPVHAAPAQPRPYTPPPARAPSPSPAPTGGGGYHGGGGGGFHGAPPSGGGGGGFHGGGGGGGGFHGGGAPSGGGGAHGGGGGHR